MADTGEIKTIFFKLHTAFLKNDRTRADHMLGLLLHECSDVVGCVDDDMLRIHLGPHYDRFSKIRSRMAYGNYGRLYGMGISVPDVVEAKSESDIDESVFHLALINKKKLMFDKLGISPNCGIAHELDIDPYGRCDMLVRDGRIWHIIEVKIGEAKSSVVSQVDKYILHFDLQMCLGLHDEVRACVIANSFSSYVATELSRLGVTMMSHDGTPESLKVIT